MGKGAGRLPCPLGRCVRPTTAPIGARYLLISLALAGSLSEFYPRPPPFTDLDKGRCAHKANPVLATHNSLVPTAGAFIPAGTGNNDP
jgi:hypothetical protein